MEEKKKTWVLSNYYSKNADVDILQIALQMFDKGILEKEDLEKIFHMDFGTGRMEYDFWKKVEAWKVLNILCQLHDKMFITNKALLNYTFGCKYFWEGIPNE